MKDAKKARLLVKCVDGMLASFRFSTSRWYANALELSKFHREALHNF